jgi:sterol desaturase/sphingolipid hydroxylase (fatty acid hydroxylase superfamily)
MNHLKSVLRVLAWPSLMFGFGSVAIVLAGTGAGLLPLLLVMLAAIGYSFVIERLIPWQPQWNRSHDDTGRDLLHALVNSSLNRAGLWLLPLLAWMGIGGALWPHQWPFWTQVLLAVLLLDLGIAAAHHASHHFAWLWRFHAVHHSVRRLYGFNGLMKHPVHQGVESVAGSLPLLLLGVPTQVAMVLPVLVAIALLGQHSNADIRTGPLKYVFANAEVHRFHHRNSAEGNVNFGLFTTFYDHLVGCFHYRPGEAPRDSESLGIGEAPDYPRGYLAQLMQPFRKQRRNAAGDAV